MKTSQLVYLPVRYLPEGRYTHLLLTGVAGGLAFIPEPPPPVHAFSLPESLRPLGCKTQQ
jgi:hypothetical protein